MSHKVKHVMINEGFSGEKILNKLIRLENTQTARKGLQQKQFTDKLSHIVRSTNTVPSQKSRPKSVARQQSPVPRVAKSPQREPDTFISIKEPKKQGNKPWGVRSDAGDREAWGQLLKNNKSKEKVSSFSSFDPLRTLHFLSKELYSKLKKLAPDNDDVLQMVADIQHALKRIPPDVSSTLHNPPPEDGSNSGVKSVGTRACQTPLTMYQEDTEKFQKIMEENTYRLETSIKQLEEVCTNLQLEKEATEKQLDEARQNMDLLYKRVKELEAEIELLSTIKIAQLEEEKHHLQHELEKAINQATNNPTVEHFKKLVDDLRVQKAAAEENSARLEYDMTLVKMENEKFGTMLAIRDREIREIQEEMTKIQEQVNQQLKKLNSEVTLRANSLMATSDPFIRGPDGFVVEIGDTTVSVTSHESNGVIKESACGDAEGVAMKASDDAALPGGDDAKDKESVLEELLTGLSPSLKSLLTSHNL